MKRIFFNKLLSLILVIIILGGFTSATYTTSYVKDNSEIKINIDAAKKVANNKLLQIDITGDFSIHNSYIINNTDNQDILFYLYTLLPNGYIIISADYKLPPVIAYSLSSNFSNIDSKNILLNLLITDIELRLENLENIPNNIIEARKNLWNSMLIENNNIFLNNYFQQWPPEGTTSTEGWIETNWHQQSPYNDFCPIDLIAGGRSYAGCPAVAIAQILNYHNTLNNVNFNDSDDYYHNFLNQYMIDDDHEEYDFPSFPELNEYLNIVDEQNKNQIPITNEDIASLIFACGVAAKQVYSNNPNYGSGTYGVNQAYEAYIKFNCTSIELLTEENDDIFERISQNIKNSYPVHLAVVTPSWNSGHNLIIDGYNTENFYHLNFGWGGSYDGWYLLPEELPLDLTVIEGVIVDIMNYNQGPDLECNGVLSWIDIKPGDTIIGNFSVKNIGDSNSLLDWEIESYPEWGIWEFKPLNGTNLTPENGSIIVVVNINAPIIKNKEFTGGIKIVNKESRGDCSYIQVSLITPKNLIFYNINLLNLILKNKNKLPILTFLTNLINENNSL